MNECMCLASPQVRFQVARFTPSELEAASRQAGRRSFSLSIRWRKARFIFAPACTSTCTCTCLGRLLLACAPAVAGSFNIFLFCPSSPRSISSTSAASPKMPSRKSNSSETHSESHRSSLRRLSSIASFQALFNRRKGNATDSTAASSSSNLSLSLSCTATEPPGSSTTAASHLQQDDSLTELPTASSRLSSKRNSYVCLPDDPIGGMPRSRTFSNLPVPVKGRKTSNLSQSKSHARLPSAFASSTRLPSPPTSTRRHSHSRLASFESKVPIVRNRVKRSDTEPLLPTPTEQSNNFGRSTAFKENITLSPIKPLPAMNTSSKGDVDPSVSASYSRARAQSWRAPRDDSAASTSSAFGFVNPYANHPAIQMARENRSSPAYKSVPQRKPTPGGSTPQPVQRWNSQPVLANVTNSHHNSLHGEIDRTRLMSARQGPTPNPRAPLTGEPRTGRAKSSSVSSSHLRQQFEVRRSLSRTPTKAAAALPRHSVLHVSCAEPHAYWAGRLCALTDRFRNEELGAQLMAHSSHSSSGFTPKGQTDKMHTPEAGLARTKRALDLLGALCTTPEAKESLRDFQAVYARQSGLPELAPPKPPTRTIVLGSAKDEEGDASEAGEKSMSENRKASFMDRLLGRQKRRSLVLA